MRKLLIILFVFTISVAEGQDTLVKPYQNLGSKNSGVQAYNTFNDSILTIPHYVDTFAANRTRVHLYNYSQIIVGTDVYTRYNGKWYLQGSASNVLGCYTLIRGGICTWSGTGLQIDVSPADYIINCKTYHSPQTQVTLAASNPTLNRVDNVVGDTLGHVVILTGIPAAPAVLPQPDVASQLAFTSVNVNANATIPSGVTQTIIYDENTEWTSSYAGTGTVNFNSTTNPFHLVKNALVSSGASGVLSWLNGSLVNTSSYTSLKIYVRMSTAVAGSLPAFGVYLDNGTSISNTVSMQDYGLDISVYNAYQIVTIPMSAFTGITTLNRINIKLITNSIVNIDYVQLQGGIPTPGGGIPNLQQVTDVGNTTTNSIIIDNGTGIITLDHGGDGNAFIKVENTDGSKNITLQPDDISWTTSGGSNINLFPTSTSVSKNITFPATNGTVALRATDSTSSPTNVVYQGIDGLFHKTAFPSSGTTYTGNTPIVVTGTTINADTLNRITGVATQYDRIKDSTLAASKNYWTKTGNKLYPNNITDTVGIGLTTPQELFNVKGNGIFSAITLTNAPVYTIDSTWYFGTSIELGNALPNSAFRWPTLITPELNSFEENFAVGASTIEKRSPVDFLGGVNMVDRISQIPVYSSTKRYLIFSYGINDIGCNFTNYDTTNFKTDYTIILNAAIAKGWPTYKIIIINSEYITPAGFVTYYGYISGSGGTLPDTVRAKNFVRATQTIAENFGVRYIDIYTPMRDSYNNGARFWLTDGIHPSELGENFMKRIIFNSLQPNTIYLQGQQLSVNGFAEIKSLRIDTLPINYNNYNIMAANDSGRIGLMPFNTLNALNATTILDYNSTGIGYNNLAANTTGFNNTAFGLNVLKSNTTGYYNSAIGNQTMGNNTTGFENTAMGQNALGNNSSGTQNTAVGVNSNYYNNAGAGNVAIGHGSMFNNNSNYNVAIGYSTMYNNSSGTQNTAVGMQSMYYNTSGSNLIAIGYHSLLNNTGSQNTGIGFQAGSAITSGNYNVIIGGNDASRIATSDRWMIFSDGAGTERFTVDPTGKMGIGTTSPLAKLHVTGNGYFTTDLQVDGTTALQGDVTVGGQLSITGNCNLSSALVANALPGTSGQKLSSRGGGLSPIWKDTIATTSGTYTPTLSNTTNVTSSTAVISQYSRVGNIVTFTGSLQITTTLAVATEIDISLPIASNFAAATDANGIGQATSAIATNAYIDADATNDRLRLKFIGLSVGGAGTIYFSGSYVVN